MSRLLPAVGQLHLELPFDGAAIEYLGFDDLLDLLPAPSEEPVYGQQYITKLHVSLIHKGKLQLVGLQIRQQI